MGTNALWIGAVEQSRVGGYAEGAIKRFANPFHGFFVSAFEANRQIVMFFLAVKVNAEGQILRRSEKMDLLFQEQRVRTQINVFLAGDEAFDDFPDLRVQQRLATGDRDHRRPAFLYRLKTLFRRELALEDMAGILDLAAAGTSQVAAEQRLQHQDERIPLASGELLPDDISSNRPRLRNGNW